MQGFQYGDIEMVAFFLRLAWKLASPFGHPVQVSTQVQLAASYTSVWPGNYIVCKLYTCTMYDNYILSTLCKHTYETCIEKNGLLCNQMDKYIGIFICKIMLN